MFLHKANMRMTGGGGEGDQNKEQFEVGHLKTHLEDSLQAK